MDKNSQQHLGRSHDVQGTVAIIIVLVFVLIMVWYVQVAPLPHAPWLP